MAVFTGKFQLRRGTSASAASNNPVMATGEPGYDTDAKRFKIGDGATAWTSLQWAAPRVLTPTTVKTTTYTAAVGELVRVDATSAGVTINLPSAPLATSQIGVIKIDSTANAVTITRGGTDIFQASGGATTLSLPGTNRANAFTAVILQYDATGGIWLPIAGWATPASGGGGGAIIVGRGTFASRPAGTNIGDLYFTTDIGAVYRWNGSSWDVAGSLPNPFAPPTSSGWTALNSGSITAALDSRSMTLTASAGDNWKGETRTLSPASNYTATFYFDWTFPGLNFITAGIILRDSVGGGLISFGPTYSSVLSLGSVKWTNLTTFSANYALTGVGTLTNGIPNWLRIRDNATTRFFEYSYNGIDWLLQTSIGRTDFIIPNQIGWGMNANSSGGAYTAITRLRHLVIA